MKFALVLSVGIVSLVLMTCKDNPPGPPTDRPPDTTSHEFIWQTFTFGDAGSSALYDVAIINDTLAYAVGEIYLKDSLGNWDPNAYNLVKWNGRRWELLRVQFYTFCGQAGTGSYPAKSIFAFGPNDIWIGMNGSQVVRWNGQAQSSPECTPVSINKLWGENPSSIWAVGNSGQIAHYDGVEWRRIESGTELNMYDIFGAQNPRTNVTEILAVASRVFVSYEREILRVEGTTVTILSDSGIHWPLSGVWFVPDRSYFVVGSGIYQKRSLGEARWRNGPLDITTYYTNAVRGTALNDVIIAGAYGECLHFNGTTWKSFRSQTGLVNGQYYAVAAKRTLVIAVGYESPRAVVVIGRR